MGVKMEIDIIGIISDFTKISREKINDDSDLIKELQIDSLGFFLLFQHIENEYGIKVTENDIFKCNTVRELKSMLKMV